MKFVLTIFFSFFLTTQALGKGSVYFIKKAGANCSKKGIVEGSFGKNMHDSWSTWSPVNIMKDTSAMDGMLKKAKKLGGNRVVIQKIDSEYVAATRSGEYGPNITKSLESAIIRGVAYACK